LNLVSEWRLCRVRRKEEVETNAPTGKSSAERPSEAAAFGVGARMGAEANCNDGLDGIRKTVGCGTSSAGAIWSRICRSGLGRTIILFYPGDAYHRRVTCPAWLAPAVVVFVDVNMRYMRVCEHFELAR
jgi:hypothetical protein